MIDSKEKYLYYLEADRVARAYPKTLAFKQKIKSLFFPNLIWEFQKTLRKLEYFKNCKKGYLYLFQTYLITRKYKKLSLKLGFSIPINVFGPGLSIAHRGTIIVNGSTRIGKNCRLHACVNIGTEAGSSDKAPKLGDNIYIAPGVKIYGDILLPSNVIIGANAVVNKSFEESNIAIAGLPAKKIGDIDIFNYIIPATKIIKAGLNSSNKYSGIPASELYKIVKDKI